MQNVAYIHAPDDSLVIYVDGEAFVCHPSHINYAAVEERLANRSGTVTELLELMSNALSVVSMYFDNRIKLFSDESITFDDKPVSGKLLNRLIAYIKEGAPPESFVKFMTKLFMNPEPTSIESLYDFLEANSLPILANGDFYAYKYVNEDYMDSHSRTFDNHPGNIVSMDRAGVTLDRSQNCSAGLHVGGYNYVFKHFGGGKRRLLVQVNPVDVVSVPFDYNCEKMRVSSYYVVKELTTPEEAEKLLNTSYSSNDYKPDYIEDEDDCGCGGDCDCW